MHFALFQRYITTGKDICPKSAPFRGRSGPHLVQGSVGPRVCPFPQTASRSIQPFLHNSPVFPTQTMEPSNHPLFNLILVEIVSLTSLGKVLSSCSTVFTLLWMTLTTHRCNWFAKLLLANEVNAPCISASLYHCVMLIPGASNY